jgi:tyrosyl-tRNA synthetase
VSVYFLVQSWLSIEKDLRKLFTNIFCFKVSKSEMDNLFNEVIEHKKDHMLDIMKLVYDKRFNFLFINTDTGRMFKNWDEIKFQEDDEDSD